MDTKIEADFNHAGLRCVVLMNDTPTMKWRCGYVGVPETSKWFGEFYDDVPFGAHGGLTFAAGSESGNEKEIARLTKQLEGAGEPMHGYLKRQLDYHLEHRGEKNDRPAPADGIWWFGFDCAHYGDSLANCTLEFVKHECEQLAEQIAKSETEA